MFWSVVFLRAHLMTELSQAQTGGSLEILTLYLKVNMLGLRFHKTLTLKFISKKNILVSFLKCVH